MTLEEVGDKKPLNTVATTLETCFPQPPALGILDLHSRRSCCGLPAFLVKHQGWVMEV